MNMGFIKKMLMGLGILFIVLIFLGIVFGSSTPTTSESKEDIPKNANSQEKTTPIEKHTTDPDVVFTYLTYTTSTTTAIDQYTKAPAGYMYLILDMHINNTGKRTYSTNPFYWSVIIDGNTYSPDTATFSQEFNRPTVEVGPGGKSDFYLVYVVPSTSTQHQLKYTGF